MSFIEYNILLVICVKYVGDVASFTGVHMKITSSPMLRFFEYHFAFWKQIITVHYVRKKKMKSAACQDVDICTYVQCYMVRMWELPHKSVNKL